MNQQERVSRARQNLVNDIILNAEGLIAAGLDWVKAAQVACKSKNLYKDEVIFIRQYLNYWHQDLGYGIQDEIDRDNEKEDRKERYLA